MESILGFQIARLVSGADLAIDYGRVCAWVVRRRASKKPNQPASWNWPRNLRYSDFPGIVGLVLAQEREQETESSCPSKIGGK